MAEDVLSRRDWESNGYTILSGAFSPQDIEMLGRALEIQCRKYAPERPGLLSHWTSDEFHSALIKLRQDQPKIVARIYDSLQTNAAVQSVVAKQGVLDACAHLLGDEPGGLSTTGLMIRMDFPGDQRNRLHWHQERSYYSQNDDGNNGLVLWAAMHFADEAIGTIRVCPGSHSEGFIQVPLSGKDNRITSEQFMVPDNYVSKYTEKQITVNAGDAVLFSMNLFHASGTNTTNRVRLSFGVRYHRASTPDFHVGRLQFVEIGA